MKKRLFAFVLLTVLVLSVFASKPRALYALNSDFDVNVDRQDIDDLDGYKFKITIKSKVDLNGTVALKIDDGSYYYINTNSALKVGDKLSGSRIEKKVTLTAGNENVIEISLPNCASDLLTYGKLVICDDNHKIEYIESLDILSIKGSYFNSDSFSYFNNSNNYNSFSSILQSYSSDFRYSQFAFEKGPAINVGLIIGMIVGYLIIIGPVLLLVLKKIDKREKCWVIIPAISVLAVLGVGGYSRLTAVKNTVVSSVKITDTDVDTSSSLIGMYSPNTKANIFELSEDYFSASPSSYDKNRVYDDGENIVQYSTGPIKLISKASESFEMEYFSAYSNKNVSGAFSTKSNNGNVTVKNGTDKDYEYLVCVSGDDAWLIEDVKQSEEITLSSNSNDRMVYYPGSNGYSNGYYVQFENMIQEAVSVDDFRKSAQINCLKDAVEVLHSYYGAGDLTCFVIGCNYSDGMLSGKCDEKSVELVYTVVSVDSNNSDVDYDYYDYYDYNYSW